MDKLYNLKNSFKYAFNGISFCVTHEKNMRIHIVAMLYVMFFSLFYDFTVSDYALLVITCALVISTEIINTAIEVVIDKISPDYSPLAKVGKDAAAGAVLVTSIMAVIVGILLFFDLERLKLILDFFISDISNLAFFIASLAIAFLFVNSGKKRKLKGKNNMKETDNK